MNLSDTEKVWEALKTHGDSFWGKEDCTAGCIDCESNVHLFDDVLEAVGKAGFELKLVKK